MKLIVAATMVFLVIIGIIYVEASYFGQEHSKAFRTNYPLPIDTPDARATSGLPKGSTPTPSTTKTVDLPPLYSGVQWASTGSGQLVFQNREGEQVQVEGYRFESAQLSTKPYDFIAYYERELRGRDWVKTQFAASFGEWHGYQKYERYIKFGFRIVSDAPLKYQAIVEHD